MSYLSFVLLVGVGACFVLACFLYLGAWLIARELRIALLKPIPVLQPHPKPGAAGRSGLEPELELELARADSAEPALSAPQGLSADVALSPVSSLEAPGSRQSDAPQPPAAPPATRQCRACAAVRRVFRW